MNNLDRSHRTAAFPLLLAGCLAFNACREKEPEGKESAHAESPSAGPKPLVLGDSQLAMQKITFVAPAPAALKRFLALSGEIALNAERLARIAPRFAGVVKEVRTGLGEQVAKGQVLALIESNESMSAYEMKSPLAGTVLERNIQVGETRKAEDTAFVVADLGTVWAEFHAFPKDMPWISPGRRIEVLGQDSLRGTASIVYVGSTADAGTHTILVRASLPNPARAWRAGILVQGRLLADSAQVPLSVPSEAVQPLDGKPTVFLRGPQGIVPKAVETGRSDGDRIEIRAGLSPRDTLVFGNAYLLKSEFEKASFSEDEGDEEDEGKDKD